jgi:hypothetical protein
MNLRWVAVLVLLASAVLAVRSLADRRRTAREISELRDDIYVARVATDSCRNAVAYAEMSLRRFGDAVDSVRGQVRSLEALDERGVPEERYDEYMRLFNAYNDSVALWDDRVAKLRADEAACRSVIERHNLLADSLRRRLRPGSREEGSKPVP